MQEIFVNVRTSPAATTSALTIWHTICRISVKTDRLTVSFVSIGISNQPHRIQRKENVKC